MQRFVNESGLLQTSVAETSAADRYRTCYAFADAASGVCAVESETAPKLDVDISSPRSSSLAGPSQGIVNLKMEPCPACASTQILPAAVLDDFFADGQANSVARILGSRVQALEDHKNIFRVLAVRCRSRYRSR